MAGGTYFCHGGEISHIVFLNLLTCGPCFLRLEIDRTYATRQLSQLKLLAPRSIPTSTFSPLDLCIMPVICEAFPPRGLRFAAQREVYLLRMLDKLPLSTIAANSDWDAALDIVHVLQVTSRSGAQELRSSGAQPFSRSTARELSSPAAQQLSRSRAQQLSGSAA